MLLYVVESGEYVTVPLTGTVNSPQSMTTFRKKEGTNNDDHDTDLLMTVSPVPIQVALSASSEKPSLQLHTCTPSVPLEQTSVQLFVTPS